MVEIDTILRNVIKKCKVVIGAKQVIKNVDSGLAKIVVVASTCPPKLKSKINIDDLIEYDGNGVELGTACGKPFSISALAVLEGDEGDITALRGLSS
ncbi:MAG: 50S ribosomal protein L30e [Methanosarcinales archaeon]|nr:MAG: 50S ribosomal protein L30e [Methanosarcinales archaeon]